MQSTLTIKTSGRGLLNITEEVARVVAKAQCSQGLCHIFVRHTSASLIISENADPDVCRDLETFIGGLVQDGDPRFLHRAEGADDMAAHVRSVLTASSVSVPVTQDRLDLGAWQGVYLWEHRYQAQSRQVVITVIG